MQIVVKILIFIIPLLYAITLHEVAHGWVASFFGDKTAKKLGRLSLNPLKHIDLVGTIILPLILLLVGGFIFGWAKPVPVDWRNLRNPRRDMALVALAGPLANLMMLIFWAIFTKIAGLIYLSQPSLGMVLANMGIAGIGINLVLMLLNLLPLPPLDGSRVVSSILPPRLALTYNQLEKWGFLILIILLASGVLSKILGPMIQTGMQLSLKIFNIT